MPLFFFRWRLRVLVGWLWLAWLLPGLALAQSASAGEDGGAALDRIERSLAAIQSRLEASDDQDALRGLGDDVATAQHDAEALERRLAPQRDQLDARLAQLGEGGQDSAENRDIASRRADLERERSELDAQIKRAGLLKVEAQQLNATIEQAFGQRLGARLSQRTASPLALSTWRGIARQVPEDWQRLQVLADTVGQRVRVGSGGGAGWLALLEIVVALALLWPLNRLLRWLGWRHAARLSGPGTRLRRSGLASWQLLVRTLMPALAAALAVQALRGVEGLPPRLDWVGGALVAVSLLSAFIGAVSAALLMPGHPSWRLFALDDATARSLRRYARLTALLSFASGLVLIVNRAARSSTTTTMLVDGGLALVFALLVMAMVASLLRLNRVLERVEPVAGDPEALPRRSGVVVLVATLAGLTVVVALLAVLAGYVNFALFATRQVIWLAVVVAALAVLMAFADDLARWLFAPERRAGRIAQAALGLRASHLEQAGVLLSALLRVLLLLTGLTVLLQPFGSTVPALFGWFDAVSGGFTIGQLKLMPGDVLRGLAVLLIGLALVQVAQRWLAQTYLPRTELDAASKASIATVARYLGIGLVGLWTLTALGLGMEKLALMVSALSVGIGFGLQAITQNFVSGLILMAERPVKIGDRVRLSDQEGEIRRISVRSTEILADDRSVLVVPNSELITKTVRNMALDGPLGRIQLQFAVPLDTDMERLRAQLLQLYAEHPAVLADPAPSVFIDSIAGGQIAINSFAYVASPRAVYGVRSELYFALLAALARQGIALLAPQDIRLVGGVSAAG